MVVPKAPSRTPGNASAPTIRLSTGAEIFDYIFHARLTVGEKSLNEHVIVNMANI